MDDRKELIEALTGAVNLTGRANTILLLHLIRALAEKGIIDPKPLQLLMMGHAESARDKGKEADADGFDFWVGQLGKIEPPDK
ncbi:hypothetical protein [uncultured Jannaschia sp.]|uniref:hypothetical protein n=1 Tax=uncultured Jannaschia sp. TaxID=293347 RepID=UPI00260DCA8E|nr:hypothetical protein [uncultured Jannaschia sp.]